MGCVIGLGSAVSRTEKFVNFTPGCEDIRCQITGNQQHWQRLSFFVNPVANMDSKNMHKITNKNFMERWDQLWWWNVYG